MRRPANGNLGDAVDRLDGVRARSPSASGSFRMSLVGGVKQLSGAEGVRPPGLSRYGAHRLRRLDLSSTFPIVSAVSRNTCRYTYSLCRQFASRKFCQSPLNCRIQKSIATAPTPLFPSGRKNLTAPSEIVSGMSARTGKPLKGYAEEGLSAATGFPHTTLERGGRAAPQPTRIVALRRRFVQAAAEFTWALGMRAVRGREFLKRRAQKVDLPEDGSGDDPICQLE